MQSSVRACVCERLHVHTNLLLVCLFEMQVICMATTTTTMNLVDNNDDTLSINGGTAEARPTRGGN